MKHLVIMRGTTGKLRGLEEPARRLNVTLGHLSRVVNGKRRSRRLLREMKRLGIEVA